MVATGDGQAHVAGLGPYYSTSTTLTGPLASKAVYGAAYSYYGTGDAYVRTAPSPASNLSITWTFTWTGDPGDRPDELEIFVLNDWEGSMTVDASSDNAFARSGMEFYSNVPGQDFPLDAEIIDAGENSESMLLTDTWSNSGGSVGTVTRDFTTGTATFVQAIGSYWRAQTTVFPGSEEFWAQASAIASIRGDIFGISGH